MIRVIPSTLFRLIFPSALLFACVIRPSLFSLCYGVLLLIWPFIPNVDQNGTSAGTRTYLIVCSLLAALASLAQLVFYLAYEFNCDLERTADFWKTIGLQKFKGNLSDQSSTLIALRGLGPDILTLLIASLTTLACFLYNRGIAGVAAPNVPHDQSVRPGDITQPNTIPNGILSNSGAHSRYFLLRFSDFLLITLLVFVASIWPSLLSLPYFLAFLILVTWWAAAVPLKRPCFNRTKLFLMLYCSLHLTALYLYQLYAQVPSFKPLNGLRWLNESTLTSRLIGFTALLNETTCQSAYSLQFKPNLEWSIIVNPILLIVFYFYCAFQYKLTKEGVTKTSFPARTRSYEGVVIHPDDGSSLHEELLGTEADDEELVKTVSSISAPKEEEQEDSAPNTTQTSIFRRLLSKAFSPKKGQKHSRLVNSVLNFLIENCYALTLVSMMAWAITYHAWLSFVWLLAACLIWLLPNSRKWCLHASPIIVFYAEILICLQFIYGIRKTIQPFLEDDWPEDLAGFSLKQLGLITPHGAACKSILLKVLYSIPFWITLRLFLRRFRDSAGRTADSTSYGTFAVISTQPMVAGSTWLGSLLVKYWIFVVGLVLLLISIREPVVAYGVLYMIFFVVLITVLQISFRFWRFMLYCYLSILILFSIVVLLLVYTYQFHQVPEFWKNWTHWASGRPGDNGIDIFTDLGLIEYQSANLFIQLLTPISFLIVVCLQLKFFHAGFMRLTNISSLLQSTSPLDAVPDSRDIAGQSTKTPFDEYVRLAKECFLCGVEIIWRLLEIHISKIVAFALLMLAISEVNAVNFVFIVLVCIMVPWRGLSMLISVVACLWAALIVTTKMLFQMTFAHVTAKHVTNATDCDLFPTNSSIHDPAAWAGFVKYKPINAYLENYILIFLLLTFQAVVYLRQRYNRVALNKMTPARGIVFPEITRNNADESLTRCVQYLINYGFYKFGVEITFIMIAIDVSIRLDGPALIYAVWLVFLISLPRLVLARFWYIFVAFMAIVLPLQYTLCLGLPPSACIAYPWAQSPNVTLPWANLIHWLFLPSYDHPPEVLALIGDFFVFLFACCQLYVFNIELSPNSRNFEGGDNFPIDSNRLNGLTSNRQPNPVPNFINYAKSYLDTIKTFIFVYFHWITLSVVFIAGVAGISLFSLGYLLGAFVILWKGNDLYTESMKRVRFRWWSLLYYNVVVIIVKVALQAAGCLYLKKLCESGAGYGFAFIQLFTFSCIRANAITPENLDEKCQVKHEEAELIYDVIVFAFLIVQLRILGSWYFRHTILEFNAERILSYRGAMLMSQLVKKEMKEQQERETKIYDRLISKTNRIRDKYVKILEGTEIYDATNYASAKRAGDYYMFDYETDDEEFLELEAPQDSVAPEVSPETRLRGVGPIQLAHLALSKDMDLKHAVDEAQKLEGRAELSADASDAPSGDQSDIKGSQSDKRTDQSDIRGDDNLSERIADLDGMPSSSDMATERQLKTTDGGKCAIFFKFMRFLLCSVPDHCAFWFNKWSRDYRYVAYILRKEKRCLKENLAMNHAQSTMVNVKKVRDTIFSGEFGKRIHLVKSASEIENVEKEVEHFWLQHNAIVRFFISLFYLIWAHTELLCYIMIILDQMQNSSAISMPLPFLVFLWGTLCSPRPPQSFWITVITYTMGMIIVKFIAQFRFIHYPTIAANEPFAPARIIGIERMDYYAAWDVALLMVLFFHRYVLKTLGLWKVVAADQEFAAQISRLENAENIEKHSETGAVPSVSGKVDGFDKGPKGPDSIELQDLSDTGVNREESENADIVNVADASAQNNQDVASRGRYAYCRSFVSFYRRLLHPAYRYIMDLYAAMFLCDLICFLILAFGFSSFGVVASKGDVVTNITSNKVPLGFVVMLIALMLLIIIDRGIYLRKNVVSKLVFQYLLVTAVHAWIFFALPAITDRSTVFNTPAKLWYFVKCIYFLLSAWQIRNGYPSRIFGNFLTKKYNMLNYSLFTGFMVTPFLFELRTLIDWIWTETCMPLFDFFTMENMYAVLYRSKCMRQMEKDYPVPKGIPKATIVKYGMGCPILLLIILLIWLPLLLFALLNAIGVRSLPTRATFTIWMDGYPPLYSMDAQRTFLRSLSEEEYNKIWNDYKMDKQALTFLRDYSNADVVKTVFRSSSNINWDISQPSRRSLIADLRNRDVDVDLNFALEFFRGSQDPSKEFNRQSNTFKTPLRVEIRDNFVEALTQEKPVTVLHAYPYFVMIPAIGQVTPAKTLLEAKQNLADNMYPIQRTFSGLTLTPTADVGRNTTFWNAAPFDTTDNETTIYAFVDKTFPSAFDKITGGGIIGLYVVVVLAAGRLIRSLVVNDPLQVIVTEMPDVDRALQLCMDIFLVREARDFVLELDLFAKLIFLFRSPETLIKWTRPQKAKID